MERLHYTGKLVSYSNLTILNYSLYVFRQPNRPDLHPPPGQGRCHDGPRRLLSTVAIGYHQSGVCRSYGESQAWVNAVCVWTWMGGQPRMGEHPLRNTSRDVCLWIFVYFPIIFGVVPILVIAHETTKHEPIIVLFN